MKCKMQLVFMMMVFLLVFTSCEFGNLFSWFQDDEEETVYPIENKVWKFTKDIDRFSDGDQVTDFSEPLTDYDFDSDGVNEKECVSMWILFENGSYYGASRRTLEDTGSVTGTFEAYYISEGKGYLLEYSSLLETPFKYQAEADYIRDPDGINDDSSYTIEGSTLISTSTATVDEDDEDSDGDTTETYITISEYVLDETVSKDSIKNAPYHSQD